MSRPALKYTGATIMPLLAFLFVMLLPGIVTSQTDNQLSPFPDVSLQPEDVVKIVLDALGNNDYPYPDAGIETTFNFASPANKSSTGPLERFTQMVKGPVFGVMVGHKSYEASDLVMSDFHAYQIIRLITASGSEVHFAFRLGLQTEGKYKDMWMTEAVWPLDSVVQGIGA